MSNPPLPSFNLNINEKIMLRAFIQGTQISDKDSKDPTWTTEALDSLQSILDGNTENLSSHLVQDLLCIFADLIIRKDLGRSNAEFTRIMVKFMHHLVTLIDWTSKKKGKGKPGPRPTAKALIPVLPQEDQDESQAEGDRQ